MRHTAWIGKTGWIGLAAAMALTLSSCRTGAPAASPSPRPTDVRQSAELEARFKEQTVRRDMEATERLNRQQLERDARNLIERMAGVYGESDRSRLLGSFLNDHPELVAVSWIDRPAPDIQKQEPATAGLRKAAEANWRKARDAVLRGKSYISAPLTFDGKRYFVFGQPSDRRKGQGVVALASSTVVQEVERHQRRNLRLIPYPAEGRYRIESVKPGTTKDTTVRKGEDNQNASHYSVDEVVVKFRRPLKAGELLQIRRELDLKVVRQTGQIYVFRSGKHRTEHMMKYFKQWNPVYVEPHYLYLTNEIAGNGEPQAIVPNDTLYPEYQWNLSQIQTELGWNWNRGSQDVIVAVIDTGVQSDHPDLQGRLVEGKNFIDPSKPPEDDVGHGTHVAGIIAAQVNNNEGVAGLTWYTKIMPIKVLDSSGAGSAYAVSEGIIWAADHGADVINMSLGNYASAQFLRDAIQYAYNKGVVIVAASGNDNTERPGYPAAYPEVLAVSATDPGSGKAEYSNYGDYIDVVAPGTSIASTYPGSRYAALSGTSMASPHVAALASLVRAANPQLSNAEVVDLLCRTSVDLGDKGKDKYFGYGQIDVRRALQEAGGGPEALQLFPERVRRQLSNFLGTNP